jgi:hypothetical protein
VDTAPIEFWAERKGLLPATMLSGQRNPEHWKFAAARIVHGWPAAQLVTEQQFDEAIAPYHKMEAMKRS